MSKQLTHGSLFSGIGGFDLGAQMSSIPTLWSCEFDPRKRAILHRHFPHAHQYTDVTTMPSDAPYVDIISGGFPCQNISISNTSKNNRDEHGNIKGIKGERSALWNEYARIIRGVKPRYIVFENSPMLVKRGLEYVLSDLSSLGYDCQWQVLPANAFAYPHRRERLYGIAYTPGFRRSHHTPIFRDLSQVVSARQARPYPLPMHLQRFNAKADFDAIRVDDGFPRGLDRGRIEDCGNAVIPSIAHYLFECIKLFDQTRQQELCAHP